MADLVSRATGNLTAPGTWKGIETGTRAKQGAHTASTNTTTSDVYNADAQDFTIANLSVIEGILLFCNRVNTTGTVRVTLSENSGSSATKTVTVDAADLPASPSWVFFKFATSLTGDGGTDYAIAIQGSSAGNATFFRDATAANWTHLVVTDTSPGSVAAGDVFFVVGELTGQGTGNNFTVTMNSTTNTDYGTGADGTDINGMEIGKRGILTYGTTAATNYYLKLSGSLNVWGDGTLNIGTTGTPIPRDSTAILEFDPVADGGMGLLIQDGGTCNIQGLSRTVGKDVVVCRLNTDEAIDSTSLGVDTDTGWLDNDEIAIASSTPTATQCEKGALNGNAGASTLTVDGFAGVGGGLAFAHSGTTILSEIILLTRNIKVRSATSTIMSYVNAKALSIVDIDWAEFRYLGENATGKRGIEIATNSGGSFSMEFCSLHDTEDGAIYVNGTSGSVTISHNVGWNINNANQLQYAILIEATSGAHTISDLTVIYVPASSGNNVVFGLRDLGSSLMDVTIVGVTQSSSYCFIIAELDTQQVGSIDGLVARANSGGNGGGIQISPGSAVRITNSSFIMNVQGIDVWGFGTFDTCLIQGNTNGISVSSARGSYGKFINCTIGGLAGANQSSGLLMSAAGLYWFYSCTFGSPVAHTAADIVLGQAAEWMQVTCINCNLLSTSEVNFSSSGANSSFVRSHKNDQSSTTHKNWYKTGTVQSDQTVRHTASGFSWKLTPSSATRKLRFPGPTEMDSLKAAVNASTLVTVKIWVRKSATYNGNAPRLVLVGGIVGGIAADVVASLSVGADTWEELTVTATPNEVGVVEFYVDCDGTAGDVFVDDVTVSQA